MTRELIEATNASSQSKLEIKQLNQQLREKQVRVLEVEEALKGKDQATQSFKEEQIQILHDQKAEFMRVQEQLKAQNQSLKMERDSLEVRLKQLLIENQGNLEMIQMQDSGQQERVRSFMEENEKLKKQMFAIDKQYRNLEASLADE